MLVGDYYAQNADLDRMSMGYDMKIAVIGAGNVGATAALAIAEKELGDVLLLDIAIGIPKGKGLDMLEAAPLQGVDTKITGSNDNAAMAGSDIVVVTAGLPRKPGMSRDDLLQTNAKIVRSVAANIKQYAPQAIVIVVTNPLDVMTYLMFKELGCKPSKVMGMAGVLDSTRFRAFIAEALDVSTRDIQTMVLGSHGDSMVPLVEYTTVAGIPLVQLLPKKRIDELVQRTRDGGAEIVKYLQTGSAFYAPGYSIAEMVEAIVKDSKRILPAAAYLDGEYGLKDIFAGVPVNISLSPYSPSRYAAAGSIRLLSLTIASTISAME